MTICQELYQSAFACGRLADDMKRRSGLRTKPFEQLRVLYPFVRGWCDNRMV